MIDSGALGEEDAFRGTKTRFCYSGSGSSHLHAGVRDIPAPPQFDIALMHNSFQQRISL